MLSENIREDKKTTYYFQLEGKNYRLCYSPGCAKNRISIVLNDTINKFVGLIAKVANMQRYGQIKVLATLKHAPSAEELDYFVYCVREKVRETVVVENVQINDEHVLLLIISKISLTQ
ncbi:hypothetical protein ENBRE01_0788 [Enteropsectra breve]|nr:hypothetical protein ENBRE01_0788 [Enteropsectra breve]